MKIDLEKGIIIKIGGELGRYHTLPIDTLIELATNLQDLIIAIAKFDIPNNKIVDINNFKIELSGFEKNSADPIFIFTPRVDPTFDSYKLQRDKISEEITNLLEVANEGDYLKLKEIYPGTLVRNNIVKPFYGFINSFGKSPTTIGQYRSGINNEKFFNPKCFKQSIRDEIISKIKNGKENKTEYALGEIEIKNNRKKIRDLVMKEQHSLSYSPEIIPRLDKTYILNYPLRCLSEREDDYFIIRNEQLDIIGTGRTREEAEMSFNEEFDYIFNRLNSLTANQLSKRLLNIKFIINHCVKEVHNNNGTR